MNASSRAKFVVLAVLAIAVFFFSGQSKAETADELKTKIEQKNAEIKKLEEEARQYRDGLVSTQTQGKTLKQELARIDRTVRQLRNDITLAQRRIERTNYQISELDIEILAKEASLKKMRSGLAGIVQAFYERDQQPLLLVLLEARLSDFFQTLEYFSLIEKKVLSSLDEVRALRKQLEIQKAQAQGKREELKELSETLKDTQKIQEGVRQERGSILKLTQNQEKKYQELLRETEKKQEEILRDIEKLEEALRGRIDAGSLPPAREGLLQWPAEGILSQGYGETPFTRGAGRHFYSFHNGIDISAAHGSLVRAADDGTVLAVGDTDRYCPRGAYGKYIVLNHNNNLATMYAHLSLTKVVNGQEVKRGDIIGYMGSTGLSTGPHLHFTLYDARTVEIRLGSIGTCGLLPFGGSLNPLVYL